MANPYAQAQVLSDKNKKITIKRNTTNQSRKPRKIVKSRSKDAEDDREARLEHSLGKQRTIPLGPKRTHHKSNNSTDTFRSSTSQKSQTKKRLTRVATRSKSSHGTFVERKSFKKQTPNVPGRVTQATVPHATIVPLQDGHQQTEPQDYIDSYRSSSFEEASSVEHVHSARKDPVKREHLTSASMNSGNGNHFVQESDSQVSVTHIDSSNVVIDSENVSLPLLAKSALSAARDAVGHSSRNSARDLGEGNLSGINHAAVESTSRLNRNVKNTYTSAKYVKHEDVNEIVVSKSHNKIQSSDGDTRDPRNNPLEEHRVSKKAYYVQKMSRNERKPEYVSTESAVQENDDTDCIPYGDHWMTKCKELFEYLRTKEECESDLSSVLSRFERIRKAQQEKNGKSLSQQVSVLWNNLECLHATCKKQRAQIRQLGAAKHSLAIALERKETEQQYAPSKSNQESAISELEQLVNTTKKENAVLNQHITSLRDQLIEKSNALNDAVATTRIGKEQTRQLEQENSSLKRKMEVEFAAKGNEISRLKSELQHSTDCQQQLRGQLKTMEGELSDCTSEIFELKIKHNESQTALALLKSEVSANEQIQHEQETQATDEQQNQEAEETRVRQLEEELSQLKMEHEKVLQLQREESLERDRESEAAAKRLESALITRNALKDEILELQSQLSLQ